VVILKNVMTRKEERQTTGADGSFNFKMEYETNYKVSFDKRSPGIMNIYKDTSFYVSTVGFNEPLDYRVYLRLEPADEIIEPIEDYNPARTPANKTLNRLSKLPATSTNH